MKPALIVTAEPNGAALWIQDNAGMKLLEMHRTLSGALSSLRAIQEEVTIATRKNKRRKTCSTQ